MFYNLGTKQYKIVICNTAYKRIETILQTNAIISMQNKVIHYYRLIH